ILSRALIPEFIQNQCQPQEMAQVVGALLCDDQLVDDMRSGFSEIAKAVGAGAKDTPAQIAARFVMEIN
ncbi:MAG: hypothetical protein VX803_08325, partial [Pseudomonadota bacterium]|nr:hypothetical protein [Pseudomonadota bacterium]